MSLADKVKGNPKRFQKYIKEQRVTREGMGHFKNQCGHLCLDPQQTDKKLNEYVFTVDKIMDASELVKGTY